MASPAARLALRHQVVALSQGRRVAGSWRPMEGARKVGIRLAGADLTRRSAVQDRGRDKGFRMPKRLMWVEYGDDAELSRSQKSPGDYSPLTRDAGGNLGHVTLSDADQDEWGSVDDWMPGLDADAADEQKWSEEDVEALALLVSAVLVAARPHVERWWKERALPTIRATNESVRRRFSRSRKAEQTAAVTEAVASFELAPGEARLTMSRDEAEQRLLAALVARAFSDEQLRVLLSARIEDLEGELGIRNLLDQFTPEQVEAHVNSLLDANPAFLDEFVGLCRGEPIGQTARLPREVTELGHDRVPRSPAILPARDCD